MSEITEIYGKIVSVSKPSECINDTHLKVFTINSQQRLNVISKYSLPYEKDDAFYGVCTKKTNFFYVMKHPYVVISKTEESIIKFLYPFFKYKSTEFYHHVNEKCNIFEHLSITSTDYIRDNIFYNNYQDYITDDDYRAFLNSWYKSKVLRQIELLDITKEEYEDYRTFNDIDFFNELIKNPYKIYSVSFDKADNIVKIINKKPTDLDRLCGTIVRKIYDYIKNKKWVGIKKQIIMDTFKLSDSDLQHLIDNYDVVIEYDTLYFKYFYEVEKKLAFSLNPKEILNPIVLPMLSDSLSKDQKEAIELVFKQRVTLITGSAGTGKTTIIRELTRLLSKQDMKYLLVSFTGKAVARIKELSNCIASTIHLAIAKGSLKFDVLIIDEISMVSNDLLFKFFCRYKPDYKIVIIGDPNQLPPIDWGDLTKQILKILPHYKLITQHRQEAKDLAIVYDKILNYDEFESSENLIICESNKNEVCNILRNLRNDFVQSKDVIVLSPLNKDTIELNLEIQKLFDDGFKSINDYSGRKFMITDKVIMIKNDYMHDIMNGDEGTVQDIDESLNRIQVKFSLKILWFDLFLSKESELNVNSLLHSYALTVHRSQGSEWKYVIFYISSYSNFISNNILYTALTRAKKKVWIVVNDENVLKKIVKNVIPDRLDNLAKRISDL